MQFPNSWTASSDPSSWSSQLLWSLRLPCMTRTGLWRMCWWFRRLLRVLEVRISLICRLTVRTDRWTIIAGNCCQCFEKAMCENFCILIGFSETGKSHLAWNDIHGNCSRLCGYSYSCFLMALDVVKDTFTVAQR